MTIGIVQVLYLEGRKQTKWQREYRMKKRGGIFMTTRFSYSPKMRIKFKYNNDPIQLGIKNFFNSDSFSLFCINWHMKFGHENITAEVI